jgi:HAE1 family hydrophobic/amphiphilic exporter-1
MDASPLLLDADMSWRLGQPELQVRIDRDRARDALAYPGAVGRELRTAIAGDDSLRMRHGDEIVPIRVRFQKLDRDAAADVGRIPVGVGGDRMITIDDVADVVEGRGPTRIDRRDGLRDLNFKAYLAADVSLGEARAQIEALLAELGVPREDDPQPGSAGSALVWGWRGDAATLSASAGHMIGAAVIALLLVYAIMAGLFNSAVHPLTIMLSVPMAIAGALLLLVLTGSALSIVSGIGMILLLGIVVRNAILLIDHTLTLRAEGMSRREAVLESGVRRLRPILMTTLTTIFGMLPVAMKLGKGAEIRAPMAIAVIGGLLLSTALTLVIIPVTYTVFDEWAKGRGEDR